MPSTFFGLIGMIFLIFIAWEVIATLLLCLAAWSQSREYERGFERGREYPNACDKPRPETFWDKEQRILRQVRGEEL